MSAVSARSARQAHGLDTVRALQWVLYRSAKSDPARRFHALYGHLARSDVLWRAWGDVRANRGAPGVDGVSIADVERGGVKEFLDRLAGQLRGGGPTGRPRCGGWRSPSPGGRDRPGRCRSLPWLTGW